MKVMIVDDSNIIRKAIDKYIRKYDVEIVGHATNGKDALELFREKNPDLVTLDITMPEMNGLECMQEMLKIKDDVKVIIVTALNDKATALEALSQGAHSFLGKPFNEEKLDQVLSKVINS